jgi:tRNA (cytidine/uridine-2'-O-)-methyltransferase
MMPFQINVVLFEPEIPQNTGNIVRTCAAVGAGLHLIKPLGFSVEDRYLKRAGLDYWDQVDIYFYDDIFQLVESRPDANFNFLTKRAQETYEKIDFSGNVYIVFGKETAGLPEKLLKKYQKKCFRIPMVKDARSLNLSNAAAIVVYEAFRQNGFAGLRKRGTEDAKI